MLLELEVAALGKLHQAKVAFQEFMTNEEGDTNFISVIIILAIVCALAIIFRKNIAAIVNAIFTTIFGDVNSATGSSATQTQFN